MRWPALGLVWTLSFGLEFARGDIDLPAPPPPQPKAQTVTVFVGESVDVPLAGVSRTGMQVKFLIRSKPELGTLTKLRDEDRSNALVTYTSDAARGAGVDSFRYAVQVANSGVSASAEVRVVVRERPPVFEAPARLQFENVELGGSAVEILEFRNAGGGVVAGRVELPAPWTFPTGNGTYSLGPDETARFAVRFAPEMARNYEGTATFSHDARRRLGLSGRAFAPIETAPLRIELRPVDESEVRSGSFTIRNVTDTARVLTLVAPPQVVVQETLEVGPGAESEVALHTEAGFLEALDGNVTITGNSVDLVVPLTVSPAPARLVARPAGAFDLGKPKAGETVRRTVTIRNVGGTAAKLTAEVPGAVRVSPEPTLEPLGAGAAREFELSFVRTLPGAVAEEVVFRGGAQPVRIALTGEVVSTLSTGGTGAAPVGPLAFGGIKFNAIPPVEEIGVTRLTQNEIDLAWDLPVGGAKAFDLYQRKISFGDDGKAKSGWQPVRNTTVEVGEKQARAFLKDLRAGEQVTLSIVALDADGNESQPSPPFQLATKPPTIIRVPWTLVVIVALGGCVWVVVRERRRSREERDLDDLEVERRMRL